MTTAQTIDRKNLYRRFCDLSDQDAARVLGYIDALEERKLDEETLTPDELRQLEASNAQLEAGEFYTQEEVEQRLAALP